MWLADALDEALPQTQCGLCGFKGCRPYAEAMARGEAEINQCPPGGADAINELSRLTQRAVLPLDDTRGVTKLLAAAVIDETWCIGCTLCIQACPVDAIAGAAKWMHTVIADECTGCELCIPPCPVDCISMQAVARPNDAEWRHSRAMHYRARYVARSTRLARVAGSRETQVQKEKPHRVTTDAASASIAPPDSARARAVALALARARERLAKNKTL